MNEIDVDKYPQGKMQGVEKDSKIQEEEDDYDDDSDDESFAPPEPTSADITDLIKARMKLAQETGAYDVSCFPSEWLSGYHNAWLVSKEFNEKFYNEMMSLTDFVIQRINAETTASMGKTYKLVQLKKAVEGPVFEMFLAFTAWEFASDADVDVDVPAASAPLKTILAKVYYPGYKETELEEWRHYEA